MTTNYGLKINTKFSEEEIEKKTKVINIDEAKHFEFFENNFITPTPARGASPREAIEAIPSLGEGVQRTKGVDFLSHTVINLNKEGASVEFVGRYKANKSLCDVSCVINHNANNTKSKINIKGIAETEGKIISRSNLIVKENVNKIDGEEKVKFIFVTDENGKSGEIDAIPNLDISSNEVKVSHALSISKIKKADIFYAGLNAFSEKSAEKIFEESFLN